MNGKGALFADRCSFAHEPRQPAFYFNRIDNHSHLRFNTGLDPRLAFLMYVCLCKSVTDKQIRRAAADGVSSLYQLREVLGVAAGCGSCADMAEAILECSQSQPSSPTLFVPVPA